MRTNFARRLLVEYQGLPPSTGLDDLREIAEADWILRRFLTPGRPDCVLPADEVPKLRKRLLAKVRDQRRRQGIDGRSVRIGGETARRMDRLAKTWNLKSRSDVLERLVEDWKRGFDDLCR
jgi:hypothetical protein